MEKVSKICGKCQTAKPLESFYPDPRNKDGKRGYCIECDKKYFSLKTAQRKASGICTQCCLPHDGPGACCSKCLELKRQQYSDRDKNRCRRCHKPELITAQHCETCWLKIVSKKYLKNSVFWSDLKELFVKQNGLCALSGMPLKLGKNASLDHIIPTSKNGADDINNYRWVHTKVNLLRRDLMDAEFYDMCIRVVSTLESEKISCKGSPTWSEPFKNGIF